MKNTTAALLRKLSDRGYRLTAARRRIVAALNKSTSPISIKMLAKKVAADEASVYRTIRLLVDEGLAEEIVLTQGKAQYAVAHGHHHHVVCEACGRVEHVPCGGDVPAKPSPLFALIQRHEVTYYGVCNACHS